MPERHLGRTLGKYRVEALLGTGGFAWVYRAFDPDLEIPVAVKVLKPQFAGDPDFEVLGEASVFEQFEIHDYIAQGDRVVVLGHERQRVKATGLTVENDFAMVFTIRDGKIARFRNYEDTAGVAAAHRKA